jgi:hypothetical protein
MHGVFLFLLVEISLEHASIELGSLGHWDDG